MTPQEFLAVVLPSPNHGLYCTAELSTKKKEHVFADSIGEALEPVTSWVTQKYNTYFALATFDPVVQTLKRERRTAANARYLRALFIDMDGYASKKQAALALNAFLAGTGLETLGVPWVVASGGGLHCYWPLSQDVTVEAWKPVAENFKRLCKQESLAIDMTVTADSARVMRVPDTFNFKEKYPEPRPVKLMAEGDIFDFDTLAQRIRDKLTALPAVSTPSTTALALMGTRPQKAQDATAVKLFENSVTKFRNILNRTKAGTGCAQLKHYVENASDEGMEPLWRGWLSQAKVCVDGEKAAIWLSQLHPYDEDRMHAKLRDIKGPYPCVKFDSENPGICPQCPHFGKITNPLALGRETPLETTEKEVFVATADGAEMQPVPINRPPAPYGFGYGKKGGVYRTEVVVKDGVSHTLEHIVLPYDLFVVHILNNQGTHLVHLMALKPHEGAVSITIPQKAMVSADDCTKALAEQNILAAQGKNNDAHLFRYVRAAVEQASIGKVAVKLPASYGWQKDGSFVFAGQIYSKGYKPLQLPMPGLENIVANTRPTGSLEAWRDFVQLLIHKGLYKHLAVMLFGAGAPLMRFTGIYGMTLHCGSTESGTGKSLALEAAASVWGHPTHYRTGKGTSPVAMQQRLGMLNSLPLITDEITSKNRANFEWFPEFLLDMTEGRGKERMESGTNKERMNLSTWMTNAIMSSNTHAVDSLTGGRMHASEGELRRLIEFVMTEELSWEPEEIETLKSLQQNYGVVGDILAQYMVEHVADLEKLVPDVVTKMYQEFKATNDERFWMAGIASAVGAGLLLSTKHTGVVNIPLGKIVEVFREAVDRMRDSIKGGARTAEDVLNAYIRENYGQLIIVRRDHTKRIVALFGTGQEVDAITPRTRIMGRVEHIDKDFVDFFVEERMLRAHCASMSFGYTDFKRQIDALGTVERMPRKDMTSKTDGPQMRVSVLRIRRRVEDTVDGALPLSVDEASQG